MTIETFRVSKKARDQLITLKRRTGIDNWNVLCRWAFCASLAAHSRPRHQHIPGDSSVELAWRTFAGEYEGLYLAMLKQRCQLEGTELTKKNLTTQFRLHLHRGIGYLAGDPAITGVSSLIGKSIK